MAIRELVTVHRRPGDSRWFTIITLSLFVGLACTLASYAATQIAYVRSSSAELLAWTAGLAILNLLPVPARNGLVLAPDIPLGVAMCMIFHPLSAGLVGFVGSFDRREFTEPGFLISSLYNRCNQALGLAVAGWTVHLFLGYPGSLLSLVTGSAFAYLVWSIENYIVLATGRATRDRVPFATTFKQLHTGKPLDYGLTLVAWCITGALLAKLYGLVGIWTVPAFLLVTIITRQMLVRSDSVLEREAELEEQRSLVKALSQRMASERKDERASLASYLHDEVIQSMFQASLLCQVVRLDLSQGRLLDLDVDIPAAQAATEGATEVLRAVIKDLRSSAIGPRGVSSSLRALIRDAQASSPATISDQVVDVPGLDPDLQLIFYQVGREALVNALRHGRARNIEVSFRAFDDVLELIVRDDGVGFDSRVRPDDHFGILLMEERVESAAGVLYVDSELGRGTTISARVPLRRNQAD